MDRDELGATLRAWRERLSPADVGLPAGVRRRTPGLRREEVAQLAGVSVDYLNRLEQGRGAHPSESVLGALARALRLSTVEHDHLFHLAGSPPPGPGRIRSAVRPSVLRLMDRFTDLPALLLDAKRDVLAWNASATALLGDFSALPQAERNMAWLRFAGSSSRVGRRPGGAGAAGPRPGLRPARGRGPLPGRPRPAPAGPGPADAQRGLRAAVGPARADRAAQRPQAGPPPRPRRPRPGLRHPAGARRRSAAAGLFGRARHSRGGGVGAAAGGRPAGPRDAEPLTRTGAGS